MSASEILDRVFEYVIALSVRTVMWILSLYRVKENEMSLQEENTHSAEAVEEDYDGVDTSSGFKLVGEVIAREKQFDSGVKKNTVMYAHIHRVPIFKNPTIEYDAQIGEVPYGEMVIVLEPKGRFYHIMWNTIDGWVLKDDIADRSLRVHPVFTIGEENEIDHPNTAHVRTILCDIFGLGRSEFPLQAGEYVLYRLWKKGIRIAWPDIRPRVPGLWHKILRGVGNIHIGVSPKVGSIMEYIQGGDVGHLAFVEAVFPDNTIVISEVNYPDNGIYNERELKMEKWKTLKPLFITVK